MEHARVAFIGLGSMGAGMAARLVESGYPVVVYNRTRSKAESLAELGAGVAASPAEAASAADVVLTSLSDEAAVSAVLLGSDGALAALPRGGYAIDLSTVPPAFARRVSAEAAAIGCHALDACVYGAPWHARTGELRVLVGAESEADFQAVEGILRTIGKEVSYMGPSGMGAMTKLVVNMLMGVQMPALAEAIVLGERAGLSREALLGLIAGSGYASPVMSFRCDLMRRRAFANPAFRLSLMRKDMKLAMAEAQDLGVPLPVAESAYTMLTAAQQQGLGDLDVGAVLAFQERLAGLEAYPWPLDGPEPAAPEARGRPAHAQGRSPRGGG